MKLSPKLLGFVFLGGALGSALRHAVSLFESQLWQLVLVNTVGALVIGLANARQRPEWFGALVSIGFAGGLTTMSGVALLIALSSVTVLSTTLLWVLLMCVLGIAGYFLGARLGKAK